MNRVPVPVCIDNFGEAWYTCAFTGQLLPVSSMKQVGKILRQAPGFDLVANSEEGRKARLNSVIAFDDMDANCNACRHLQRDKTKVKSYELRHGTCLKDNKRVSYHPDDWMGMQCFINIRGNV